LTEGSDHLNLLKKKVVNHPLIQRLKMIPRTLKKKFMKDKL
jgi:hypothetical protein